MQYDANFIYVVLSVVAAYPAVMVKQCILWDHCLFCILTFSHHGHTDQFNIISIIIIIIMFPTR